MLQGFVDMGFLTNQLRVCATAFLLTVLAVGCASAQSGTRQDWEDRRSMVNIQPSGGAWGLGQ